MSLSLLTIGCWVIHLLFGAVELGRTLTRTRLTKRVFWISVFLLLTAAIALYATRATALRGGHGDEQDFKVMSADAFLWPLENYRTKEIAPTILLSAVDRITGFSLAGFLTAQKALWIASALLLCAALRRSGETTLTAIIAGGLVSLSFLAILNTYAFSATNSNVFCVASALYVLAAFRQALRSNPKDILAKFAWLLVALFLVLTSRLEFVPAFVLGSAFAVWLDGKAWLRRLKAGPRWRRYATLAGLAAFSWSSVLWASVASYPTHSVQHLFPVRNLEYEFGEMNLSPLFGLPKEAAGIVVLVLVFAAAALLIRDRPRWRDRAFWPVFLIGWILYFSCIFFEIKVYPLIEIRHHLYFFLPIALLAAVVAGRLLEGAPRPASGIVVAALLSAYFVLNAKHVEALQSVLRTNDLEWQFLYEARARWPSGCRVVPAAVSEFRRKLITKYFPVAAPGEEKAGGCLLSYVSPGDQVMAPPHETNHDELGAACGDIMMERRFAHRFYTLWHGPWAENLPLVETVDPVTVHAAFCRVNEQKLAMTHTYRRFEAGRLNERGIAEYLGGRRSEALRDFLQASQTDPQAADALLDAGFTLESLGKRRRALSFYDRAIQIASVDDSISHREVRQAALAAKTKLTRAGNP